MNIAVIRLNIHSKEEVRMFKFIILVLMVISFYPQAEAYTVSRVKNVPTYNNYYYNGSTPYNADLTRIERYLFNSTYTNESDAARLNRIEKNIFNKTYSSMSAAQRMNNVLANYRGDYQGNYYTPTSNNGYYAPTTMKNRLLNSFVGQPTGYTPSITNSPYLNRFGPSYNRGYYGTNGWGYHNTFNPTMTGAGIHILD